MTKWYINKRYLHIAIAVMIVGFAAYLVKQSPQLERLGLVIFLIAGTFIMVRGIVKITMGMRQKRGRKGLS